MPELMDAPRLSILLPTFNRYGRLLRGLTYLYGIASQPKYSKLFKSIEIIIADGTSRLTEASPSNQRELYGEILFLIEKLNRNTYVYLSSQPDVGFLERLSWLSAHARGNYITLMGDEDFLIFDSIADWLDQLELRSDFSAIAGQYVNIKGFEHLGSRLKLFMEEGLVSGLTIDAEDIKSRLVQWTALGCNGIPSISYSLMRRDVFVTFGSCLDRFPRNLTYCGAESLLHFLMLGAGKVEIKDSPFIFRDFTYLDHTSVTDLNWSNERQDKETWNESLRCLNSKYSCFLSDTELYQFGDSLRSFMDFGRPGRFKLLKTVSSCQFILGEKLREKIDSASMRNATLAWKSTAQICYKSSELQIVGAPRFFFESRFGRLVYKLLSFLRP